MKNTFLLGLFLLIVTHGAYARQKTPPEILKIGDKLPDLSLKLINHSSKNANILSEFKGKYIILDFWATWCGSCVESFPKLEKLQNQFSNKLKIISITKEDEAKVTGFFRRAKKLNLAYANYGLPVAFGDTSLYELFKPGFLPHYVWVNSNGIIEHITGPGYIKPKFIKDVLDKKAVSMDVKTDSVARYKGMNPLFIKGNAGNGDGILSYAILSKRIPNALPYMAIYFHEKYGYRISGMNASITDLYRLAYDYVEDTTKNVCQYGLPSNRLIIDFRDPSKYLAYLDGVPNSEAEYVYQRIMNRPASYSELKEIMKVDLKNYFGLTAEMKKVNKQCLVLRDQGHPKFKSKGGKYNSVVGNSRINVNNFPLKNLVNYLMTKTSYIDSPYPLIDETTYKGNIDITVEGKITDYKVFNELLKEYGLQFELQEKEVNVLFLSEPKDYIFPTMKPLSENK